MKKFNIPQEYLKMADNEEKRASVTLAIDQQIQVLQRLIENNMELSQSPLTYNLVCGLIDQLKTYVPAIFINAEDSLKKELDQIMEDHNSRRGKPLFGEYDD